MPSILIFLAVLFLMILGTVSILAAIDQSSGKFLTLSCFSFIVSILLILWVSYASRQPWDYIETPAIIIQQDVPNGKSYSVGYYNGLNEYKTLTLNYAPSENKRYIVRCPNIYKTYSGINFTDNKSVEEKLTHLQEVTAEK